MEQLTLKKKKDHMGRTEGSIYVREKKGALDPS